MHAFVRACVYVCCLYMTVLLKVVRVSACMCACVHKGFLKVACVRVRAWGFVEICACVRVPCGIAEFEGTKWNLKTGTSTTWECVTGAGVR